MISYTNSIEDKLVKVAMPFLAAAAFVILLQLISLSKTLIYPMYVSVLILFLACPILWGAGIRALRRSAGLKENFKGLSFIFAVTTSGIVFPTFMIMGRWFVLRFWYGL